MKTSERHKTLDSFRKFGAAAVSWDFCVHPPAPSRAEKGKVPTMPGNLAGLFGTVITPPHSAEQLEQPRAKDASLTLPETCEQLRAISDANTVLTGLRNLRKMLQESDTQEACNTFLRLAPNVAELSTIWETQALTRHEDVSTALLLVSAQLLQHFPVLNPEQNHELPQLASLSQAALDQYADSILTKRAKYLHRQLSSTIRHKANATLDLLGAIASRGKGLTSHLVKMLDMTLPALVKLAHPPKKKSDDTSGKSSLLRSWGDKDPLRRPSCALLVTLAQAILRNADAHTLNAALTSRPLMAALLHHLSIHPHAVVIETLQLIRSKVLDPAQGLPAALQAEAFSDSALLQLAYVSEREGGGPRALEASNAAHDLLMTLGTDPSHGMLPTPKDGEDDEAEAESEGGHSKPSSSAGQARLLRLLHKLKVTEMDRHAEVLLAVTAASPAMAADYLTSCSLTLEPKASSSRWLVGMTLVGQVAQAAGKAADPFQEMINGGQQPPNISSPSVQAFIRRATPLCLPRAVLSKGIQHPDALVCYTTLCTLLKVLQTLAASMHRLQAAIHSLAAVDSTSAHEATHEPFREAGTLDSHVPLQALSTLRSNSGAVAQQFELLTARPSAELEQDDNPQPDVLDHAANLAFATLLQQQQQDTPLLVDALQQQQPSLLRQWTDFALQLQLAFRARLPDPQSLLAVLSTLQRSSAQSAVPAGTHSAAEAAAESAQLESDSELPSSRVSADSPAAAVEEPQQGLEDQDGMTAHQLTSTVLVMVLNAYQSCLPEAMSDSRIDVVSLMPQDALDLPPLQQHALLELQLAALPSHSLSDSSLSLPTASSTLYSAASFLPVLKLLTGSASHGVSQLANQLLTRRMTDLLGGAFEDEVALWLGLLPKRPSSEEDDDIWTSCVDGVLGFLAEALASLGRRPQYYWGLMQSLLASQTPAAEPGMKHAESGFSLLAVSAVQQALKVACSSKLPSESRTWVSAYTAAVTAQLLRTQTDPQPLCRLVTGLFCQAADTSRSAATEEDAEEAGAAAVGILNATGAEHAAVLSLPVEAQPLASLLGFTQDLLQLWQNPGSTSNPGSASNPGSHMLTVTLPVNGAVDTPEAMSRSSKKKRKGGQAPHGETDSRKKQKGASAAAASPHTSGRTPEVSIDRSRAGQQLDELLSQCEHAAPLRGQTQQQLLTALYQCPAAVVMHKIADVFKPVPSSASQDRRRQTEELLTAACRVHSIPWGFHPSAGDTVAAQDKSGNHDEPTSALQPIPFLLLLQNLGSVSPGGTQQQAQLLSSLHQMPPSARNLASLALQQQLQLASTPPSILLFFTLLQHSLGLHSSPPISLGSPQPETFDKGCREPVQVQKSIREHHIVQLLQQPWLMTHWLTGHPQGSHMAAAWDSGLTELLVAVLSLSHNTESRAAYADALDSALTACQPYMTRLTDQLRAYFWQATLVTASPDAAAAASVPAAAAAAAHLATFFSVPELLSLTQEAVRLATSDAALEIPTKYLAPQKETGVKTQTLQEAHWVVPLALNLAEALITSWNDSTNTVSVSSTEGVSEAQDRPEGGARGVQEGVDDAWVAVVKGLLMLALTQQGNRSIVQQADMLLLKFFAVESNRKTAAAVLVRCFSSCSQQIHQYLDNALHLPTAVRGKALAQLMKLDHSFSCKLEVYFDLLASGDKAAAGAHTNKATALLLPAALAHLEQLLAAAQRAKHAASRPQHAQHESARGNAASGQVHIEAGDGHTAQTDAVRLFYEKELMVYLTARSKSPQGFELLTGDAISALHKHAVQTLKACWELCPADAARTQKALHRLLPATGWTLPSSPHDGSSGSSGSSAETHGSCEHAWLPTPGQQAEAAAMLLQQAEVRQCVGVQGLVRFAQSCLATLTAAYKQLSLSERAQELVKQLTNYTDGFVGDYLADLPDQDRSSSPFSSLAGPVRAFAAAVLKFKLASPATIKLLRRLLAALLPDSTSDAMETASYDDSPPPNLGVTNPSMAAMASQIFDRLISHSKFVPLMLDMQHSLLPLPAAAQKLKLQSLPQSILPLIECRPVPQTGLTVKGEVAELLDTLIDLQQSYPSSDPSATPIHKTLHALLPLLLSAYGATLSSPDQSLLRVLLHINDIVYQSPIHQEAPQHCHLAADAAATAAAATSDATAAPASQCVAMTNAGLEDADQANGDAVNAVGDADGDSSAEEQPGMKDGPITAMLNGPLAMAGFKWGAAAKAAHEQGLLLDQSSSSQPAHARAAGVGQHTLLEAARCALTTIHYPEHRTLTADEPTAEPLPAALHRLAATAQALLAGSGNSCHTASSAAEAESGLPAGGGGHRQTAANPGGAVDPGANLTEPCNNETADVSMHLVSNSECEANAAQQSGHDVDLTTRHHAAGYDPVWMLLFAVKGQQDSSIGREDFINQGLLSLCLRSLAAHDPGLRALAYEAVGLFLVALAADSSKQTHQIQLLLQSLKRSISQPFQQLPGVIATFAAEAVFVLMSPGSAMYPAANKLLLKRPELNIQEIPLMYQLLVSGNQQRSEEQAWVMRLLAAGLWGPLDAQLYRRRFVVELLMSLHDSPLANRHIRRLAIHTLSAVPFVPAYAKDLLYRAGLQVWLDKTNGSSLTH